MRTQHDCQDLKLSIMVQNLKFMGPKTWNILPKSFKEAQTLNKFKLDIKHWIPSNCPCKLCKHYIQNVGYTN